MNGKMEWKIKIEDGTKMKRGMAKIRILRNRLILSHKHNIQ